MITGRALRRLLLPPGELGHASPELDPLGHTAPRQVLVIASNPRTGSNLLGSTLAATGKAGAPREYLLGKGGYVEWRRRIGAPQPTLRGAVGMLKRRVLGDAGWSICYRWTPRSMRRYLAEMSALRTTSNGVFAVKVHAFQATNWFENYGIDIGQWDVPVRWVRIERDDRLAQAVSYAIALQTNRWSSTATVAATAPATATATAPATAAAAAIATPVYDVEAIEGALAHLQAGREYWSSYFARNGIEPLELTYEGLVADRESSVRSVLQLVGVEVEAIPPAPVERQASAINAEWIARFTQDRPHLARGARGAAP